jgi:hypothetical protein
MKNRLLKIVILGCILSSCGYERSRFDCDKPFVVGGIVEYSESFAIYQTNISNTSSNFSELFSDKASFIAKKGLYNLGDTIHLLIKNKK